MVLDNKAGGQLYIVSAPSGAGKTSLVQALITDIKDLKVCVSHTTRPKRDGELEGINYFFITTEEFSAMADDAAFLEYAEVFGNYYGTTRAAVSEMLTAGQDVILEIDWQGAQQVRKVWPDVLSIFIIPPSLQALRERLQRRNLDAPEVIHSRLQKAAAEIAHFLEFDYLVVNDDFARALADLQSIIRSQQLRLAKQRLSQQDRLVNMLSSPAE